MFYVLWGSNRVNVKYNTLHNYYERGGLEDVDISHNIVTLKILVTKTIV